jgi:hypothetical protein
LLILIRPRPCCIFISHHAFPEMEDMQCLIYWIFVGDGIFALGLCLETVHLPDCILSRGKHISCHETKILVRASTKGIGPI